LARFDFGMTKPSGILPKSYTECMAEASLWREIESERETAYLLKSPTMKSRLVEAKTRDQGIPLDEAINKLGI